VFGELALGGRTERWTTLFGSRWHTTLMRRDAQGRPVANVFVEVRTLGPFATRRTVRMETAARSVRLELNRGLELGIGMPKWLRRATAIVDGETIGVLTIEPGRVTMGPADGAGIQGEWRFEGRLLGYMGLPDPVVFGAVTMNGGMAGELSAPRLHTYHEALGRGGTPLWRGVPSLIDGPVRDWMLALTALVLYCASVGEEWHDHRPGRRTD